MSTTIDQRVVEMRFDNKHFESNVATTMSSLSKLKQSLQLPEASRGLENVNSAVKGINMSGLGSAVEAVQAKFSAMGVIGVTALANITNSAVNAGKRLVSALTVDPIKTGFSEYETKINAIQTIMSNTASKGTTMEDVTRVIGELNTYADKTIYNFAEMTRNIGTFTAAGVGLEESASAIQGIANLAAASGSSSQQASTAMYQLSQALAAGTVKLMDWNSVVNAGMGGEKFQEALKATAREHGVAVDEIIEDSGSFRDSLQAGWISADILNETLSKFTVDGAKKYAKSMVESGKYTQEQADALIAEAQAMEDAATKVKTFTQLWDTLKESAQSGWSQTWEIIVGDFEEAKETLTKFSEVIGNMINASAEARNKLLQGWKDAGGRADLIDSLYNAFEAIMSIITPIKEAFREIFPPTTVEQLVSFTEGLKNFTAKLKLSDSASDNLKRTFKGLFSVLDIVRQVFVSVFKAILPLFGGIDNLGGGILGVTAIFGDWLVAINETIKKSDILNKAAKKIAEFIKLAAKEIKAFINAVKEKIVYPGLEAFNVFLDKIKEKMPQIKAAVDKMKSGIVIAMEKIGVAFQTAKSIVSAIGDAFAFTIRKIIDIVSKIGNALSGFLSSVKEKFSSPSFEALRALLERIGDRMAQVKEAAQDMKSGVVIAIEAMGAALANCQFFKLMQTVWDGVKRIGSGVAKAFGSLISVFTDKLGNADFNGFFDLVNSLIAGGIGVGIMKFLKSTTDTIKSFKDIVDGVVDVFDGVRGCLEAYQTQLKAGTLMKIAGAIAILVASLVVVSLIDSAKLSEAVGAITMLFADLVASMAVLDKTSTGIKGLSGMAFAMIEMSISVLILASALKKISGINPEEMTTALAGIAGLSATMVAVAKIMGSGGKTVISGATQMVIFSAAITILASVCKDLATLSWEELAKGLIGVGVLMGEVSLFLNNTKLAGKSITTATGIVILGAALKILASVCKDLASLNWDELAKGLVGVGALLTEVSLFLNTTKIGIKSITTATGIVILGAALKILTSVCKEFAQMQWEEIGKGLAAVGGLLAEVAIFTKLTSNAKHVISTGIALIAIAAAMKIFASATQDMSKMSWQEIAKGLVGMAGALLAVTLAVNLMPNNIAGIGLELIVIGAAMKIFATAVQDMANMSWEEIARGLVAMAGALAIIAVAMNFMPKSMILTSVGLLVVAGALIVLAKALESMGGMTWEEIAKGLVTLAGAMLIISTAMIAMIAALPGAAALLVVSASLAVLTPVLMALGSMTWEEIAKGLVTLAGAFTVIGVAGLVLGPIVPTILGLAGAFALIGVGVVALGAGLMLAGTGFSALAIGLSAFATSLAASATAIVAGLSVIILGIANLIPTIVEKLGEGLLALCEVIAKGTPAIGEAIKAIVLTIVDVLNECVPAIADCILRVVSALLSLLVEYTPQIVDSIFQFLVGLLEGVARNLPSLIQAAVDVVMAFFSGVIEALKNIDTSVLLQGIAGVGLMSALMLAFSAIASLIPGAMIGVLGMGAVIAELALVLAAVGALAQIPGLDWLISEGGQLLQSIGVAIGQFFGGIVGGFMGGVSSQFPQIGSDLSAFMVNVQPFINGAKNIDASVLDGVKSLAGVILALTAANVLNGLTSWFTGGSSLSDFGMELAKFGPYFNQYYESVKGIDGSVVQASANAAKALAEMTSTIPNEGGAAAWFAGENSISKFGSEIVTLGQGLKGFSLAIAGIDPAAMIAAADAAKSLAEMTSHIPNEGGLAAWFAGENSISKFGNDLISLGTGLKGFSLAITGIDPAAMIAAADAAKVLAEMTSTIPNEGGVSAWFSGENSISKFGNDLISLGIGLKGFSVAIAGIDPAAMIAASNAAKSLAEMTSHIPNEGGLVAWFSGENSISKFGSELVSLGTGLKGFSIAITGVVPENITAAASAAKALAEMTAVIPKEGGIKAWFTGETSIANFASKLPSLGSGIKGFSDSVAGIIPANITSASTAAKTLAEMTNTVPSNSDKLVKFGTNLTKFGGSLKTYFANIATVTSTSISMTNNVISSIKQITSVNADSVTAVSNAIDDVASSIKGLSKVPKDSASEFNKALKELGKSSADGFVNALKDMKKETKIAGQDAIKAFVDGVKSQASKAQQAFTDMVNSCSTAIKNKASAFMSAGKALVVGFANGISANSYMAAAKAKAMAEAAERAAKEALDINSPSKVFRSIGTSIPEGFAMGIDKLSRVVTVSSVSMAKGAIANVKDSISHLSDIVNSDIDAQPTIRPVLDLSDVESGVGAISGLFGKEQSVGVLANVGAINSMMNQRNQNGDNGDIISAINKLRKDIGNMQPTSYTINGITYDDGSNVSDAVRALVRAAKVERRT